MLNDAMLRMIETADPTDSEDIFLRVALAVALREVGIDEPQALERPIDKAALDARSTIARGA